MFILDELLQNAVFFYRPDATKYFIKIKKARTSSEETRKSLFTTLGAQSNVADEVRRARPSKFSFIDRNTQL